MLTELLARNAADRPSKVAIVQGDRRLCHADLEDQSVRLAARLRRVGIGRGEVVAIVLPNCPEFVIAFFAIMRVEAVAMPLSPGYTDAEIGRFLATRPVRAMITDATRAARGGEKQFDGIQVIVPDAGAEIVPLAPRAGSFAGDALYLFTSGSTGSTKRVLFTQQNLYFEALNFVESTGLGPGDPILCPVPLCHSYGLCLGMLDAAYTGATLVLEPQPDAPFSARCPRLLELLQEENVRVFPGVPWQFTVMAEMAGEVAAAFRNVTWCMSSGDMLQRRTYDRFLRRTGRRIRSFYGSTEAGSVSMETGPETDVGFDSVGPPLKNVSISVRGGSGENVAPGETGEVWIRSPSLPPTGYDDDPERTKEVFREGWYNSRDLGHLDQRGRLVVSGRKQSFISIGSYKVDATEVEETLLEMPGVREAAVVGVEIPNGETMIKAVLVMSEPPGSPVETALRTFCRRRLAVFKVPRIYEFVTELPRDPMGKVLRRQLASADRYVAAIRDEGTLRFLDQIHRAPVARQRTLVMQTVERHAAAVLGRTGEPMPRDAGFADLGMDSFGSIELLTRLDLLFGPGLSPTFTFDHPTIAAATDELVARLRSSPAHGEGRC